MTYLDSNVAKSWHMKSVADFVILPACPSYWESVVTNLQLLLYHRMISVLSGAKHKIAAVCCLIEEDTAGSRLSNTFTTPDSHPYIMLILLSSVHGTEIHCHSHLKMKLSHNPINMGTCRCIL